MPTRCGLRGVAYGRAVVTGRPPPCSAFASVLLIEDLVTRLFCTGGLCPRIFIDPAQSSKRELCREERAVLGSGPADC